MKSVAASSNRPTLEWLVVTCFCALLAGLSACEGWLSRIDQTIYDDVLSSWLRPPSSDLVIIGIDDASLASVGRWPWSRRLYARLIEQAHSAGAAAVVLDLPLEAPSPDDPEGDRMLAQAMRDFRRVVLPLRQEAIGEGEDLPLPLFANSAAFLGHDQVEFDPDGIVRSLYLWGGFGAARNPHLALALLRLVAPEAAQRYQEPPLADGLDNVLWQRADWLHIRFSGPPGSYTHYSFRAVLNGDVPASALQGKILFVGLTASGFREAVPTPTSGLLRPMSGIEVQANVFEALRRGATVTTLPPWAGATVATVLVLVLMLFLLHAGPSAGLIATFLLGGWAMVLAFLGLHLGGWWFGPAPSVVGCALAYPLWSWRRLVSAQRYLDAELAALEREGTPFGEPLKKIGGRGADPLERQIGIVRQVAQHQRDVRRFMAATLENLPIGVVVIDPHGRVILHNGQARLLLHASEGEFLLEALRVLPWPAYLPMRGGLPDLGGFKGARQFELASD